MAHRHQRKRVRHRSRNGREDWSFTTAQELDRPRHSHPIKSPAWSQSCDAHSRSLVLKGESVQSGKRDKAPMTEDDVMRSIRVFGGSEDDAESTELCGPMLDVVLGLFGGMDYDD